MQKNYHCCATCVNFAVRKDDGRTSYHCSRLGYETKPTYQFNCWDPKEKVRQLIEKNPSINHD